mmetsp:Transcript_80086/g.194152  ORF Transcript_80086/g.194152 Transcript_80086/m.194152 type:complete len:448 (-) Transcript_80086:101-1444(-)
MVAGSFLVLAVLVVLVAQPPLSSAATWHTAELGSAELLASPSSLLTLLNDEVALAALSNASPGPQVAPAFRAHVVSSLSASFGALHGTYIRDAAHQRFRMRTCSEQPIFRPGDHLCMDQLSVNYTDQVPGYNMNMTVGEGADSVCKVFPNPYYDTFALLALAKHQGSSSVAGEPCDLWVASWQVQGTAINASACIGADGVPRQFNQTTNMAYKAAASQVLTFSNISVGPQPEEAFRPSEACTERWPAAPCPEVSVEPLMLYRVRSPKEPNTLENRNTGDALGDMAFFCDLSGLDESQVVTSWSVQANSSWGQYAYCLYNGGKNTCYSGTGRRVGRESALGLGKGRVQGQCSDNADVGSWFSLPADGRCPDGAPIGQSGCTWTAQPLRTVSARCILEDRGLKASCARERGHAPMLRSAAIFRAALETADPSRGGCPNAGEASEALVIV